MHHFWVLSYSCSSGRAIDFLSFQLIMVFLYPVVIQPFFNKVSPLKDGDLRTHIESLASRLNFPLKHLYEIDGSKRSSHGNAYFFGLHWVCSLLSSWSFIELMLKRAEQTHRDIWHPNQPIPRFRSRSSSSPRARALVLSPPHKINDHLPITHHLRSCRISRIPSRTTSNRRIFRER